LHPRESPVAHRHKALFSAVFSDSFHFDIWLSPGGIFLETLQKQIENQNHICFADRSQFAYDPSVFQFEDFQARLTACYWKFAFFCRSVSESPELQSGSTEMRRKLPSPVCMRFPDLLRQLAHCTRSGMLNFVASQTSPARVANIAISNSRTTRECSFPGFCFHSQEGSYSALRSMCMSNAGFYQFGAARGPVSFSTQSL